MSEVSDPGLPSGVLSDVLSGLPETVEVEIDGAVAIVRLNRANKRNALNDNTVLGVGRIFAALSAPSETTIKVVVLDAAGDHFSAGLDLSELGELTTFEGIAHSQFWHDIFDTIERGPVPVIAVLKGAVIGGGLEYACAAHIRVAEPSTFYALPEGQRGLFVGGGASVRLPRLIGAHRVADLMLTGRVYTAEEGLSFGISQYLVGEGEGLTKALELAQAIGTNSPVTNYAVTNVLPLIAEANPREGFVMESLIAAISQGSDEAKDRMRAFLEGRGPKVKTKSPDSPN